MSRRVGFTALLPDRAVRPVRGTELPLAPFIDLRSVSASFGPRAR